VQHLERTRQPVREDDEPDDKLLQVQHRIVDLDARLDLAAQVESESKIEAKLTADYHIIVSRD
jgi:hypothetical protein